MTEVSYNDESFTCLHENIVDEKGIEICIDCGEEIQHNLHDKDWKYYGYSDNKHIADPNRVTMRKIEEKSIYRDVENLGFSETIVNTANKIYAEVTNGKIFRGKSRRAIVFACIFHAYKMANDPQTHEDLIRVFQLERKSALRGLKQVNLLAPRSYSEIRTTYISPASFIVKTMEQFFSSKEQKEEVLKLYNNVAKKSTRLNRSRPQSVSAGLIFYWICKNGKDISIKEFANQVSLSEITISKIAKEISEMLEPNTVFVINNKKKKKEKV